MPSYNSYSRTRLDDRQITELIGIARGVLADGVLVDEEIALLYNWLIANEGMTNNPLIRIMIERISEALSDQIIDHDEREDIYSALKELTGHEFEIGEMLKPTTLPLDIPCPIIVIHEKRFCFSGTFVFGKRTDCEIAVEERGGFTGGLAQSTDFLVVGAYATDSWIQSSYGRKIEKAVEYRNTGFGIKIISESDWRNSLD